MEGKEHKPKLRFKEFQDDWEIKKLGDVGNIVNGLTYSPKDINSNGVLVLRSSNIQNGQLSLKDNVFVNVERGEFNPIEINDILICVRNGSKNLIGKNIIITTQVAGAAFGAFMTVYRSEYNKFISQLFNSDTYYREIHKNLGATINSINGSDLKKFKFGFPSDIEQQKIASFLSAVNSYIENLIQQNEALEKYKKGMMQKIFSQQIRFKDENGKEFPEWSTIKLSQLGKFYRGHSYSSENVKETGLLVLRSSNIKNDKLIIDSDLQFVDKDCSDEITLRKDDLVICMANGSKNLVGKTGRYLGDFSGKATVGAFCSIFRSKNLLSRYLFQSSEYRRFLIIDLAGTNINNLKNSDLENLKFKFPTSQKEEKKIENFLVNLDEKIELISQQINSSAQWKKGLLQQLFI